MEKVTVMHISRCNLNELNLIYTPGIDVFSLKGQSKNI